MRMRLELTRLKKLADIHKYSFALYVKTQNGADVLIDGPCTKDEADAMLKIAHGASGKHVKTRDE